MKLKAIALILCFVLILGCFTGCGKKSTEEEQVTEVTEETSTETTTLATTQTTTVATTETTTVKANATNSSPNTTAKSTGGSTGKVNSAVIAEASSGKKQPVSKAVLNASKPKETTTPTGARIVATSAAVCDIMDRLGIGLVRCTTDYSYSHSIKIQWSKDCWFANVSGYGNYKEFKSN